jgi:hypothetical protein
MPLVDIFLTWWLKVGRYPWSRLYRTLLEQRYGKLSLPPAQSVAEVTSILEQVTWTMDGPLHLYDAISLPETVWSKKHDDCDGFAVLAATLLKRWDPSTTPALVTVMLHPAKESHTVCVFREGEQLRFFDNAHLNQNSYQNYEEVVKEVQKRGDRVICWDVVDPERLQVREFHRGNR